MFFITHNKDTIAFYVEISRCVAVLLFFLILSYYVFIFCYRILLIEKALLLELRISYFVDVSVLLPSLSVQNYRSFFPTKCDNNLHCFYFSDRASWTRYRPGSWRGAPLATLFSLHLIRYVFESKFLSSLRKIHNIDPCTIFKLEISFFSCNNCSNNYRQRR